jgi:hypothetical protein
MPSELVHLPCGADLNARERRALEVLLVAIERSAIRRLPDGLELVQIGIGVARAVTKETTSTKVETVTLFADAANAHGETLH